MTTLTNGVIVFVEGNNDDWYYAQNWQKIKFFEFMKFGTQKSMAMPNKHVVSDKFKYNDYEYCFHVYDDWGPVYLENITTGRKREIKYLELYKSDVNRFNIDYQLAESSSMKRFKIDYQL